MVADAAGQLRLAGLAVAAELALRGLDAARHPAQSPAALRAQREAAERDVLAAGVLMHGMLSGSSALDEPDSGRVIVAPAAAGREIVRLPWTTPHPLAEPCVPSSTCHRPPAAPSATCMRGPLQRALEGWLAERRRQRRRPAGHCCPTACAAPACCRRLPRRRACRSPVADGA